MPLAPVRVRVTRWLLLAVGLGGIAVLIIGARPDLRQALQQASYLALLVSVAAAGTVAAASAMTLSVPGAERTPIWRVVAAALAAAWVILLVVRLAAGGDAWTRLVALPNHWACVAEIGGLSLVSGWVFLGMLRRAAPLQPRWTAGLAALASAACAAATVQIICRIDDPAHHLVSHVVPAALVVALGVIVNGALTTRRAGGRHSRLSQT
jgi:hypothetical protein